MNIDDVYRTWWYYNVELRPNEITNGIYPTDFPFLPKILLRQCDISGKSCLDIGSMEGIIPVLMHRRGANVVASDTCGHCLQKMYLVIDSRILKLADYE